MNETYVHSVSEKLVAHHHSFNPRQSYRRFEPAEHVEKRYPWDGGPLIINPIYTLYHVGIYWVYPLLRTPCRV